MNYLRAIRPLNLFIIVLTQYLFYKILLSKYIPNPSDLTLSSPKLLWLFIAVTVIITACGYLINDVFDEEVDQLNQRNKGTEKTLLLLLYYVLFFIGLGIAYYIAQSINKVNLISIYIVAFVLLYLYSSHLKSTVLIGNILVALFSAFVIGILGFTEYPAISQLQYRGELHLKLLIGGFMLFAFALSLVRELIKDLEDQEGDKQAKITTLATKFGSKSAKGLSLVLSLLTLACLVYWKFNFDDFNQFAGYVFYLIIAVMIIISALIVLAKSKKQYFIISQLLKAEMLIGLVYLMLS